MKATIFLVALLVLGAFSYKFSISEQQEGSPKEFEIAADPDHCFPYTTCETCIAQKYCGWCSTPVIGGNGAQCAGFSPTNGSSPFICIGTYQTTTCIMPVTSTTSTSTGSTGTTGTTSSTGSTGTTGTTGTQPKPVVGGTWRGLQVNDGYVPGEWNFDFTADNVTIKGPNSFSLMGTINSSPTQMDIVVLSSSIGGLTGQTLKGIYESDFGPATFFLTWGVSPPGVTPAGWASVMKDPKAWTWIAEQPKPF